jgi:2-keto-3-deoxy-L-rhamnonate aldolase RhmA
LIIPMVNSAAQAEHAVRESKFPPRGSRGFGYCRANRYGADFADYAAAANDDIAVVVQIEHRDAMAELDGILAVEGVDGAFIGPYDLSGSMGITGQFAHPDMIAALATYRAACERHAVAAGMHVVRPDSGAVRAAVEDGYTLIALGLDTVFLETGAKGALAEARSAGPGA